MRGEQYLTKKEQFDSVYKRGSNWANKNLVIRVLPNNLEISRFGITVSRRVGKAVVRNRIKRLIRETVRKIPFNPGYDIVFIARVSVAEARYSQVEESIKGLLDKAGLLTGEYEGISSRDD